MQKVFKNLGIPVEQKVYFLTYSRQKRVEKKKKRKTLNKNKTRFSSTQTSHVVIFTLRKDLESSKSR